jgi:NhaP-type Na+/H+ or K+/H+ antiporter
MDESNIIGLASILILGIGAQWIAWKIKFPSIFFLLLFGFIAGPVTGFLDPDKLLGDTLLPLVSISVAIILFEGGLSLRIKELREIGKVVLLLITLGVLITWAIITVTAYYLLGLNLQISVILGAILVVTGPTVIGPLVRHIRPTAKVANILKWEGIIIDPIGALLAVLVFDTILVGEVQEATKLILINLGSIIAVGTITGMLFAWILVWLISRFLVPDFLQETFTLTMVVAVYMISEMFQEESGLFAATLMGIILDNQKLVTVKHIAEFKENLRVLIISSLFIILSARMEWTNITMVSVNSIIFLIIIIFLARPLSVFISTYGSNLKIREKLFLSWMAPRGIVAAAISSVFAFRLAETGMEGTNYIVPITFIVIIGTVTIYGLTSLPVARWLKVAQSDPQGVLILGAEDWQIELAKTLLDKDYKVAMIDSNRTHVKNAQLQGIKTYFGNIMAKNLLDALELEGIGKLLALTPNDEVNAMAVLHMAEVFNREELYQLTPITGKGEEEGESSFKHLRGRYLFGEGITYNYLKKRFAGGAVIKATKLTDEFDYQDFVDYYNGQAIPLFMIRENKNLVVFTKDSRIVPKPGNTVIALVEGES